MPPKGRSLLTSLDASALSNGAQDQPPAERNRIAREIEAHTVLVRPGGPDGGPASGLPVAEDAVEPVGWFSAQQLGLGLLFGHGGSPSSFAADHSAASWGAKAAGYELAVIPRATARPEGAELHGAEGGGSELG